MKEHELFLRPMVEKYCYFKDSPTTYTFEENKCQAIREGDHQKSKIFCRIGQRGWVTNKPEAVVISMKLSSINNRFKIFDRAANNLKYLSVMFQHSISKISQQMATTCL